MIQTTSSHAGLPRARVRRSLRMDTSAETNTTEVVGPTAHSIAQFEDLARNNPARLAGLIAYDLQRDPVLLSEAAEAFALCHQATLAVPALLELLEHPRPFVRESALVGLAPFLSGSLQARDRVREIEQSDPSPGVRDAAADILASI